MYYIILYYIILYYIILYYIILYYIILYYTDGTINRAIGHSQPKTCHYILLPLKFFFTLRFSSKFSIRSSLCTITLHLKHVAKLPCKICCTFWLTVANELTFIKSVYNVFILCTLPTAIHALWLLFYTNTLRAYLLTYTYLYLQTDNDASTSSLNCFTGWMLFLTPNQQYQSTGLVDLIHRVKWRHISVVAMRSPFCGSTRRTVCS